MKPLAYLNKYLWKYRQHLILGIIFVTISNLFAVFPAQIVRYAFDLIYESIILYKLSEGFILNESVSAYLGTMLLLFAIIVVCMALLRGFFMFMMRQTIIVASRHIEFDLKNEIYAHFQKLSMSFYRRNNTGDLMARITEDVNRVRLYLGPAIMYSINLATLIILVLIIMVSVNPVLTFYVMLPFPVLAFSVYYVNSIIQKRSTEIQAQLSRLTIYTQEMFSGIRVLKSFASEDPVREQFNAECKDYHGKSMRMARVDAVFFPAILLLVGISTLLTLYIGGREVMAGRITPGNVAEFFIYVNLLSWPVAAIGWVTSLVQRAAASQRRINEFLYTKPEIKSESNIKTDLKKASIILENVGFTYPDTGIRGLHNINFSITPGNTVGIIGRTGAGKSTLAYLLMRLYDPTEGNILVGDQMLKNLNLRHLRSLIGYVPQDDFLFSDTIANNILFGMPDNVFVKKIADYPELYERVKKVAKISGVYEDIEGFPNGFDTLIGERGVSLSGGQKQRVALARALVGEPALLILDDCFSAIDTYTEARILQNLPEVMDQKTCILISHRVSTVKNADQIIVLHNGEIAESGLHDQLIGQTGYYRYLHERQKSEKELGQLE